ncbi:MAG: DNA gyrase C-terminal beta-propeller domain-containing protein, partial [Methylococcaceae bacterium]
LVSEHDEIMLITDGGVLVRTKVDEISIVGRNTQGVRVIRLGKKEKLVGIDRIEGFLEDEDETENGESVIDKNEIDSTGENETGEES